MDSSKYGKASNSQELMHTKNNLNSEMLTYNLIKYHGHVHRNKRIFTSMVMRKTEKKILDF